MDRKGRRKSKSCGMTAIVISENAKLLVKLYKKKQAWIFFHAWGLLSCFRLFDNKAECFGRDKNNLYNCSFNQVFHNSLVFSG